MNKAFSMGKNVERCQKSSTGEIEDGEPASDKSEGVIVWSI